MICRTTIPAVASRLFLVVLTAGFVVGSAACEYGVPAPSSVGTGTSTGSGSSSGSTGSTTLTYTKDVQPLLAADCVRCHGPSRRESGVDVSTYANVMKYVVAGNANSLLVRVTRTNGLMYSEWSGNRAQKAQTVLEWVVSSKAAE